VIFGARSWWSPEQRAGWGALCAFASLPQVRGSWRWTGTPLIARTGYAASKHALHGLFESLRTEVEPLGLKVLLVCPSFIETGIEKNALDGDGNLARHPQSIVGTRATPDAMAGKIHAAAARERRLLLPDAVSRLSWWLSRLAPPFYERLMTRKLGREME
jgi:short-subunit dehydrogenase